MRSQQKNERTSDDCRTLIYANVHNFNLDVLVPVGLKHVYFVQSKIKKSKATHEWRKNMNKFHFQLKKIVRFLSAFYSNSRLEFVVTEEELIYCVDWWLLMRRRREELLHWRQTWSIRRKMSKWRIVFGVIWKILGTVSGIDGVMEIIAGH